MQEHFLFDDGDPRRRGKGCDALHFSDTRLKFKFKWKWPADYKWMAGERYEKKKSRTPCQISEAVLKDGWKLEAVFWYTNYEAVVNRYGNQVCSYGNFDGKELEELTKKGKVLLTRLDAQLKAEELFEQLGHDILKQCSKD